MGREGSTSEFHFNLGLNWFGSLAQRVGFGRVETNELTTNSDFIKKQRHFNMFLTFDAVVFDPDEVSVFMFIAEPGNVVLWIVENIFPEGTLALSITTYNCGIVNNGSCTRCI